MNMCSSMHYSYMLKEQKKMLNFNIKLVLLTDITIAMNKVPLLSG